jgi:hypothetical protein
MMEDYSQIGNQNLSKDQHVLTTYYSGYDSTEYRPMKHFIPLVRAKLEILFTKYTKKSQSISMSNFLNLLRDVST